LSYAHIFITYFLVTKQKKKQRNKKTKQKEKTKKHKNKAKRKNKETQKQSKKKKHYHFTPGEQHTNSPGIQSHWDPPVNVSLANPTLNSPGVSSMGPHVIGTGITPGEFLL
jgi:hypothetical protein